MSYEQYEDKERLSKPLSQENCYSPYRDLIYYTSRDGLKLAMLVTKPAKPSYIVASTHGWHMTIPKFASLAQPKTDHLLVEVDMRGRAFSEGKPDCNGRELLDVVDAVEYVKREYRSYIASPERVYFEGGSGGGGNAFAIAGKLPDYFMHITALSGMSDYEVWYKNDAVGEFRDEMDVWVGDIRNTDAYTARSGIKLIRNLCAPISIVHGEKDIRVPCWHSDAYVEAAREHGKEALVSYLRLKGVGGQGHYENITPAQSDEMRDFIRNTRLTHTEPVSIPEKGEMVVGGYLITKRFSVFLESMDNVALLRYDCVNHTYSISGEGKYTFEWKT